MSCPICSKRKPQRHCPAKGEKICAVCCGTEREVTLDCPADCAYLVAAYRYEDERRSPVRLEEIPYPDLDLPRGLISEREQVVTGLVFTLLNFAAGQSSLADRDTLAALGALAETYRTLGSGIYYEKPPDAMLPRGLYDELAKFVEQYKKRDAERAGFTSLKDSEVFHVLVFLLRVGREHTNGRPRTRKFLEFLRAHFPYKADNESETPRIILP